MPAADGATVESFAPVLPAQARLLILGSMPGIASLRVQQYYAHPHNRFWPFMDALFGVPRAAAYEDRLAALRAQGIALWDVLAACERPGSLDADIVRGSERPNDIAGLVARHPELRAIALNGGTAQAAFRRHVQPRLAACAHRLTVLDLPSTSPANAGQRDADKLAAWSAIRAFVVRG